MPAGRLPAAGCLRWWRRSFALASFDDLVELATIEPDATALRAEVDLDALAVAHRQLSVFADRALHGDPLAVLG
jgi:hypothetical protein|tara:strand:- start:665 stop:886 length:222 start_codon:yes stop_codon:yes gene_type:complete